MPPGTLESEEELKVFIFEANEKRRNNLNPKRNWKLLGVESALWRLCSPLNPKRNWKSRLTISTVVNFHSSWIRRGIERVSWRGEADIYWRLLESEEELKDEGYSPVDAMPYEPWIRRGIERIPWASPICMVGKVSWIRRGIESWYRYRHG